MYHICVFSQQPLYGLIQAKLKLITHAYFGERDFSQTAILEVMCNDKSTIDAIHVPPFWNEKEVWVARCNYWSCTHTCVKFKAWALTQLAWLQLQASPASF